MNHTPHILPLFLWSLKIFILDALGSLGGVEDQEESEEESGEVPGLTALFSACPSTDAYSVVSVRDFLIQNQSFVAIYFFCLILVECLLRVAFDPSLRLWIETDNLCKGQDQYRIAQMWCLLTVLKCHFHPSTILNNKGKLHALLTYLYQ